MLDDYTSLDKAVESLYERYGPQIHRRQPDREKFRSVVWQALYATVDELDSGFRNVAREELGFYIFGYYRSIGGSKLIFEIPGLAPGSGPKSWRSPKDRRTPGTVRVRFS